MMNGDIGHNFLFIYSKMHIERNSMKLWFDAVSFYLIGKYA